LGDRLRVDVQSDRRAGFEMIHEGSLWLLTR
jgi:hypothetical protein